MRLPEWANSPEEQLRYHLKRAALFNDQSGSLEKLSIACGFSAPMASRVAQTGRCSKKFALAIEAFIGRDIVTREELAPFVFDGESDL